MRTLGSPLAAMLLSTAAGAANLEVAVGDPSGHPLVDAVVFATRIGSAASPATGAKASIDQVDKTFVPLVSVIQTGTEVRFPNSDNIRHSIYSFSPAKVFTEKLYSGKEAQPVVFDKPGLVVLGCNIHDQMVAWVVVVDTPYFAKSAGNGVAELKDLTAGEYELRAWYPGPTFEPTVQTVHVGEEGGLRVRISLDPSNSPLPALQANPRAH